VVGRKSDGRRVYDEAAKAGLVAACGRCPRPARRHVAAADADHRL